MAAEESEWTNQPLTRSSRFNAPHIYVNGAGFSLSFTEITAVFTFNDGPLAQISMSPTFAKTLALQLNDLVAQYEAAVGQPVLDLAEINMRIEAKNAG